VAAASAADEADYEQLIGSLAEMTGSLPKGLDLK